MFAISQNSLYRGSLYRGSLYRGSLYGGSSYRGLSVQALSSKHIVHESSLIVSLVNFSIITYLEKKSTKLKFDYPQLIMCDKISTKLVFYE